ncbi:MAG: hypothetical protein COU10_01940 [Candidatus Harrisonbacteria bacterium CG10_big_fil_rev_8_21_14_0_10_45_28]|uniref:Uncharacterized protein n=1 Tax=Candidatus Harrisonbacteria bacterium CG10_big_fil_rev_8_21_14_0_10_45_28 TaxID=1974586 RepID=A0A2H0UNF7_9BACT|nr:MAG: hypothetical protein COU10_01940 [Candidatus Harrisonbacteria bacterium CG10_big_fil_rev_8_21_14_0_10_45_28]
MNKNIIYSATALGAVVIIGTGIASAHQLNNQQRRAGAEFHQIQDPTLFQAHHDQMQAQIAEILGLSQEALQAELDAGKKMPELAKTYNVDLEAFHQTMEAQRQIFLQERLDKLVADGTITQEVADARASRISEMPKGPKFGHRDHSMGFGKEMNPASNQ